MAVNDPIILATPAERAAERDANETWSDHLITGVEAAKDDPDLFYVTVSEGIAGQSTIGGWTTGMPWPVEPKPLKGMRIRVWGQGLGSRNSGVSIVWPDGLQHVYYQTKREQEVEHAAWIADHQRRQRREFIENKAELDAQFEALPGPLKRRIQRFRDEDPDFRWQSEAYEMASCAEAGRLYRAAMDPATGKLLKDAGVKLPTVLTQSSWDIPDGDPGVLDWEDTPELRLRAIDAINSKVNGYDYAKLETLFPWIDKGHSGNTWGHAVKFAWLLIREGEDAKL